MSEEEKAAAAADKKITDAINEAVEKAVKPLTGQITGLKKQLSDLKAEAAKPKSSLAIETQNKKAEIPSKTFKVESGREFQFIVPSTYIEGSDQLAEELLAKPEMLEKYHERWVNTVTKEIF